MVGGGPFSGSPSFFVSENFHALLLYFYCRRMSTQAIVEEIFRKVRLKAGVQTRRQTRFLKRYLFACLRTTPCSNTHFPLKVVFYDHRRNMYFSLFPVEKNFELIARKVTERVL